MKRVFRQTLLLLGTLTMMLLMTGCNLISKDDFAFHGAKIVGMNIAEGAKVEMILENKSPLNVTVVGGELTAYLKGEKIGTIYMREPVKLPKKSTTTVMVDVGFRFSNPMAALRALGALTSSPDEITVSGYGEGKVWFFRKRFERTDVPLSKFIAIFGTPTKYF